MEGQCRAARTQLGGEDELRGLDLARADPARRSFVHVGRVLNHGAGKTDLEQILNRHPATPLLHSNYNPRGLKQRFDESEVGNFAQTRYRELDGFDLAEIAQNRIAEFGTVEDMSRRLGQDARVAE